MNTKLIVSILVLGGAQLIAPSAQASVTWNLVGTSSGLPDLVGVMFTPDLDVNCPAGPPEDCPIGGWLTIPEGSLGGPGTTINLAVDPTSVTIVITAPINDGNNFDISGIVKDGYTCGSVVPAVFRCSYGGSAADYYMEPVEGAPRVVIGSGDVWISDELQVGGQTTGPGADTTCSVAECNAEGVTTLTCGATEVEIACAQGPGGPGGLTDVYTVYNNSLNAKSLDVWCDDDDLRIGCSVVCKITDVSHRITHVGASPKANSNGCFTSCGVEASLGANITGYAYCARTQLTN